MELWTSDAGAAGPRLDLFKVSNRAWPLTMCAEAQVFARFGSTSDPLGELCHFEQVHEARGPSTQAAIWLKSLQRPHGLPYRV